MLGIKILILLEVISLLTVGWHAKLVKQDGLEKFGDRTDDEKKEYLKDNVGTIIYLLAFTCIWFYGLFHMVVINGLMATDWIVFFVGFLVLGLGFLRKKWSKKVGIGWYKVLGATDNIVTLVLLFFALYHGEWLNV